MPDTGEVTADRDQSFTADATHVAELLGGGEGGMSIGGQTNMPILALEPDRQIVIEVEKLASGSDQAVINARWFELPTVLSETSRDLEASEYYD